MKGREKRRKYQTDRKATSQREKYVDIERRENGNALTVV